MAQKWELRLERMESTLADVKTTVDGLDHIIRGNGNLGLVATQELQDLRIKTLEDDKKSWVKSWRELIILMASGGVIAVLTEVVQHFVR